MLVAVAAGKLKKRAAERKETNKRKQQLRKELFGQVSKHPEYKEAVRLAQVEMLSKWEQMEGASKYDIGLWVDLHTRSVLSMGMDLIWTHVSDDQDELIKLKEDCLKAEERCTSVQKRALQEVTSIRNKFRRIPDDMSESIESVEFFNALDFVDPQKRHLMECIIKEELRKLVQRNPTGAGNEAEPSPLAEENNTLKKDLEEKTELLENAQVDAKRVQSRARELESLLDELRESQREERRKTEDAMKKLRHELSQASKGGICDVDKPENKINPIVYNPATKKHVAWFSLSEEECASMDNHGFQHSSELQDSIFGDFSSEEGNGFICFSVERNSVIEARRDVEKIKEMREAILLEGRPLTDLREMLEEFTQEEERKIKEKYEGLSEGTVGDPKETETLKVQIVELEEKCRVLEAAVASNPQGAESAKIALKVASLEKQLKTQEEAKDMIFREKQKEVDGRVSAERLVEKKNAEIENLHVRHGEEVSALQAEIEEMLAAPGEDAIGKRFQQQAKVAAEKYEKLVVKFREMETSLTEKNEALESQISQMLGDSKQESSPQKATGDAKAAKKLARLEHKYKESQQEVEKLQLQIGELQMKLVAMKNEFLKRNGGLEGFDELLESVGLKEFVNSGKKTKVFERLYEDALRRLRRLEELSFKIHEKERLAITRIMESRFSDSNFLCKNGDGDRSNRKLVYSDADETRVPMMWTHTPPTSRSQSPQMERDCKTDVLWRSWAQGSPKKRRTRRYLPEMADAVDCAYLGPQESSVRNKFGRAHRLENRSASCEICPAEIRTSSTPRKPVLKSGSDPAYVGSKSTQDSAKNIFCFEPANILMSRSDIQIRHDRDVIGNRGR